MNYDVNVQIYFHILQIKVKLFFHEYFYYVCIMDLKNWLLTQQDIDLSGLAKRMWPDNKGAGSYLSRKLHGKDGRSWTAKDEELAREHLHALGIELTKL